MGAPRRGVLKEKKWTLDELAHEAQALHNAYKHPLTQLTESKTTDKWDMCEQERCVAYRNLFDELATQEAGKRTKR